MRVSVTRCTKAFRLTMPDGSRESVANPDDDRWCRAFAIQAKDIICPNYNVTRANVRFSQED